MFVSPFTTKEHADAWGLSPGAIMVFNGHVATEAIMIRVTFTVVVVYGDI